MPTRHRVRTAQEAPVPFFYCIGRVPLRVRRHTAQKTARTDVRAATTTRKECELTLKMAGRTGLEPATSGSTVRSSNQLSYLPGFRGSLPGKMAGRTGLEPATSGSTVRSSNQLSYLPGEENGAQYSTSPPDMQAFFHFSKFFETGNISCQKEGKQVTHPTEAGRGARGRGNPVPLDPPKGAPPRGRRAPTKNKSSLRTKKSSIRELLQVYCVQQNPKPGRNLWNSLRIIAYPSISGN